MKAFSFALLAALLLACAATPKSDRSTTIEISPGWQHSGSRKVLTQYLGKNFSDSTYAVCGKNGYFAVITELNDDERIVYFCEGNHTDKLRYVIIERLATPLGECSLSLREALQATENYLVLIDPGYGSGYSGWFPKVYSLNDWNSCSIHQKEFVQFSWPEGEASYYKCTTTFVESDGKLYSYVDTSYYDGNRQFLRSSKGKVMLAEQA